MSFRKAPTFTPFHSRWICNVEAGMNKHVSGDLDATSLTCSLPVMAMNASMKGVGMCVTQLALNCPMASEEQLAVDEAE
jgi:hypothetical protein